MLVQEIIKKDGKQIGLIVNNQFVDINIAIMHNNELENVSLVNNSYFRSKPNYNIKITEVKNDVKGNAGNLGQISKSKAKSGRCNQRGNSSSKVSNGKSRCKKSDIRGKGCSGTSTESRFKEAQSSSGGTLQSIPLRLNDLGCEVYNESKPKSFHNDFHNAKLAQKNGACVDEHSLEDLSKMKLLRSDNGFVAVEKNGNINSVLRDVRKPKTNNFLRDLILNAISNGGYKLDCFAIMSDKRGGLAELYCRYGFIPVVKDHFNREFAPENWDYERDGEPDVVFMYHCRDSIEQVIKKSDNRSYKHYLDYAVPYITDLQFYTNGKSSYEQAMTYRDAVMGKVYKYKNSSN